MNDANTKPSGRRLALPGTLNGTKMKINGSVAKAFRRQIKDPRSSAPELGSVADTFVPPKSKANAMERASSAYGGGNAPEQIPMEVNFMVSGPELVAAKASLRLPGSAVLQYSQSLDGLATASALRITEFRAQELSSLAWCLAFLRWRHEGLLEAMRSASLTALEKTQLDCQGICNIAWTFATFSTSSREPLTQALSAAALAQASELNPQDLTNLAWCPATLQLEEKSSWEVLSGAGTRLAEAAAQRLSASPSRQGVGSVSTMAWLRDDLLSVVHAFANCSKLSESLYHSTLETLKEAAKVLEVQKEGAPAPLPLDAADHEMSVLFEQGDIYVLSKAPGWNVSVGWDEVDTPKVVKKSRGKHVQDWLMQNFNTLPVVNDEAAQHGIVHRLDVNTSGALLCSKTYLGYFLAQLQFVARRVRKYYVCVCAGHFPRQRQLLLHPLLESTADEPRSIVSERGRS
eukprot:s692_g5.t1